MHKWIRKRGDWFHLTELRYLVIIIDLLSIGVNRDIYDV
jgi:hypothetical protein